MSNFDLKKFLTENKLTANSRMLSELTVDIDHRHSTDGNTAFEVFYVVDGKTFDQISPYITSQAFKQAIQAEVTKMRDNTEEYTNNYEKIYLKSLEIVRPADDLSLYETLLMKAAGEITGKESTYTFEKDKEENTARVKFTPEYLYIDGIR